MSCIRPCRDDEHASIASIINAAARAYRGVIPADVWHDPYMPDAELDDDIEAGVVFWGYEMNGQLIGVMGMQRKHDVDLIRHAYVLPEAQGRGVGAALIERVRGESGRRVLVGAWADATWAVRFYQRHGFELVPAAQVPVLLETYWSISQRQIETSVVLANPPLA